MNWDNCVNDIRMVTYQGRLDKTLESQRQRLHDNAIKLEGIPEDVIVVKTTRTEDGDPMTDQVTAHKVVNMKFPILKDIPVRKVTKTFEKGYKINALVSAYGEGADKGLGKEQKDLTTYQVDVPIDSEIDVDDRIVRVFVQKDANASTCMIFDVLEVLSDFSNNAPLTLKLVIAVATRPVDFNKPLYKLIKATAERRAILGY